MPCGSTASGTRGTRRPSPTPRSPATPSTRTARSPAGWADRHRGSVCLPRTPAGVVERQTRSTPNALPARACGFESRPRHHERTNDEGWTMTAETEPQETQEGQRVLLAEDEALIRLDLAEMLIDAGYDVVGQASNGEEAV